jgi:hypothetical protein
MSSSDDGLIQYPDDELFMLFDSIIALILLISDSLDMIAFSGWSDDDVKWPWLKG